MSLWNEKRGISIRIFSFAHRGKLAPEQRLPEEITHFWGNSCFTKGAIDFFAEKF
jgi:hypothetical protein